MKTECLFTVTNVEKQLSSTYSNNYLSKVVFNDKSYHCFTTKYLIKPIQKL